MARRFQEITEVYRQEIAALARSDRWTAFLRSACRNYKLPFEEQVLVHAQRPDATAVLEIERWNRQFGRWVNKGATGIAVFDRDYPGRTRLKYYFDISDTHESRLSRPVPLWQVPAEQEPDVIEALENRFGALDDKGTLEEAIVSAMENAAADNMTDYLDDLQNCRDNSLLEELDELNLSVLYRRLLENSTAYMLMCRCGLEPDEYFDPEDFSEVFNFNTPETLNALGVATRDIAESGLSAIALTVRSRQKQIRTIAQAPGNEYPIDKQTETQTERSENHGTDIHDEGRLPAAGSAAAAGAGNSPWEIRPATPEVSEGAPEGAVHEPADIGQAERASGGDRPDGAAARGTDGDGDGSGRGRDGGAESRRPDEVGGADEQPEKRRRGDSAGGADLQLNTEPEEADSAEEAPSELPAFLDAKKIFAIIENRNDDLIYKKAQIELFFRSHPDEAERAEYLRSAYQDRFTEILADGARLGYAKAGSTYDELEMSGSRAVWPEVLAVYAVKTTADPDDPQEVATVDDSKKVILKDIFWQMNDLSSRTESKTEDVITETDDGHGNIVETVTTVTRTYLYITVSHKTAEEMAEQFDFTADQRQQLSELLAEENRKLWSSVLYGIYSGDDAIVTVALSQVGNAGGQPYWSWYGFDSRVEWCACFVSWCANECGYIDSGVCPKFSGCGNGVQWFQERGQWLDGSAKPVPGMVIFFDWDNKGGSGPQDGETDHVGIVQKVEDGIIYTVEGNSGNLCRVNRYPIGHYEILGYGVLCP